MVFEQLKDYIEQQQNAGSTREYIVRELLKVGWKQEDVDTAFSSIHPIMISESVVKSAIAEKPTHVTRPLWLRIIMASVLGVVIFGIGFGIFLFVDNSRHGSSGIALENASRKLALIDVRLNLEVYSIMHDDLYPASLSDVTDISENSKKYISEIRYTTEGKKSYQLCIPLKSASDYCLEPEPLAQNNLEMTDIRSSTRAATSTVVAMCEENDFSPNKSELEDFSKKKELGQVRDALETYYDEIQYYDKSLPAGSNKVFPDSLDILRKFIYDHERHRYQFSEYFSLVTYKPSKDHKDYTVCTLLSEGKEYCEQNGIIHPYEPLPDLSLTRNDTCLNNHELEMGDVSVGLSMKYPKGWTADMFGVGPGVAITYSKAVKRPLKYTRFEPTLRLLVVDHPSKDLIDKLNSEFGYTGQGTPSQQVKIGNAEGILIDVTDGFPKDNVRRKWTFYFINSDKLYLVQMETLAEYWRQNEGELEAILNTLTFTAKK